ncbi:MAG: GspMb/PilO family protein [Acidobacteriaceae bacterium]
MSKFPSINAENLRKWVSPLNLHLAGVLLLLAGNVYLLVHIAVAWSLTHRGDADAIAQQTIQMRAAEIAAKPLRGLDKKLVIAQAEAEKFYQGRIPTAYSTVAAELGDLAAKSNVRLTRVQYTQAPALEGLTEVRMDASLSGDYRPLVQFLNGLERDKVFFVIDGVTLTGQQSGVVNLRLRLTTYLRAPSAADKTEGSTETTKQPETAKTSARMQPAGHGGRSS